MGEVPIVRLTQHLLRDQGLRNLVPPRLKAALAENRVRLSRVRRRTELRNVYHCCVHKTGSQWIRKVLADPDVYRVTGLRTYAYAPRLPKGPRPAYRELRFEVPFPQRTIVSPLYIDREGFDAIPKPDPWRAFFVARDPRDIVVSWYFSSIHSHPTRSHPRLRRTREHLKDLGEEEGLIYAINSLADHGLFDALRSWARVDLPGVMFLRYEDLIGAEAERWWGGLLDHCDVALDDDDRRSLLARYSFKELSGRDPGQEDPTSKLRKGVAGDWRNHFTPAVREAFIERTGDLTGLLGYE